MKVARIAVLSVGGLALWFMAVDRYPYGLDRRGREQRRVRNLEVHLAADEVQHGDVLATLTVANRRLPHVDPPVETLSLRNGKSLPRRLLLAVTDRELVLCRPHLLGVRVLDMAPLSELHGVSVTFPACC